MIWVFWTLLAAWAAVGLRQLRVSNSLEAWMPDLAAPESYRSYVVIGFPTSRVDATAVAVRLRGLNDVAFCVDPLSIRATAWLTGLSAQDFVVSKDGSYSGVFCFAHDGIDGHLFIRNVQSALNELAPPDVFAIGGPTAFQCAMDQWSQAHHASPANHKVYVPLTSSPPSPAPSRASRCHRPASPQTPLPAFGPCAGYFSVSEVCPPPLI
jgi:hypothetical protein